MTDARRLLISGRVQGVSYRWFARQQAEALSLMGTVRNLPDGRVEAHAVGDPESIERWLDALRDGPPMARVDRIEQIPLDDVDRRRIETAGRFEILR